MSDSSFIVALVNAGLTSEVAKDNCTWHNRTGGYLQVQPATPAGNFQCYTNTETPLETMKAECCAAGLAQCVSIAHGTGANDVSCSKRNDNAGWVNATGFTNYAITHGHVQPLAPKAATICVSRGNFVSRLAYPFT